MSVAFLASLTSCSLWKTTTLPPLSPVANSSPDELNSTVEIMSAATQEAERRRGGGGVSVDMNKKLSRYQSDKGKDFREIW